MARRATQRQTHAILSSIPLHVNVSISMHSNNCIPIAPSARGRFHAMSQVARNDWGLSTRDIKYKKRTPVSPPWGHVPVSRMLVAMLLWWSAFLASSALAVPLRGAYDLSVRQRQMLPPAHPLAVGQHTRDSDIDTDDDIFDEADIVMQPSPQQPPQSPNEKEARELKPSAEALDEDPEEGEELEDIAKHIATAFFGEGGSPEANPAEPPKKEEAKKAEGVQAIPQDETADGCDEGKPTPEEMRKREQKLLDEIRKASLSNPATATNITMTSPPPPPPPKDDECETPAPKEKALEETAVIGGETEQQLTETEGDSHSHSHGHSHSHSHEAPPAAAAKPEKELSETEGEASEEEEKKLSATEGEPVEKKEEAVEEKKVTG
mmetsp:Transcript_47554/g.118849  ORF Transcript_47554/g.118849 Transcript_47554/m.118849 type:complete len:379 (-) Transcript_47554:1039-2175(-)